MHLPIRYLKLCDSLIIGYLSLFCLQIAGEWVPLVYIEVKCEAGQRGCTTAGHGLPLPGCNRHGFQVYMADSQPCAVAHGTALSHAM